MRDNAGPCAWAVRSDDVAAEAARLRAAGHCGIRSRNKSGRTRPDGFRLEWETATVGEPGARDPVSVPDPRSHAAREASLPQRQARQPGLRRCHESAYSGAAQHQTRRLSARLTVRSAMGPSFWFAVTQRQGVEAFGIQKSGSKDVIWIESAALTAGWHFTCSYTL